MPKTDGRKEFQNTLNFTKKHKAGREILVTANGIQKKIDTVEEKYFVNGEMSK